MDFERILPLPRVIRHGFIDLYAPPQDKTSLKTSPINKQCLARIYMGQRSNEAIKKPFTLQNFPLYLDRMEALGLELELFARMLAGAYATLHWAASIDADDIEFVLGSEPTTPSQQEVSLNLTRRKVNLWVIDFGKCSPINMDDDGAQQAGMSMCMNDPYFPRPFKMDETATDKKLWKIFKNTYLDHSGNILAQRNEVEASRFPEQVMEQVEQFYRDERDDTLEDMRRR
jgi:hypothetical protein